MSHRHLNPNSGLYDNIHICGNGGNYAKCFFFFFVYLFIFIFGKHFVINITLKTIVDNYVIITPAPSCKTAKLLMILLICPASLV